MICPTKAQVLTALKPSLTVPVVLVDKQDVGDIIKYMRILHPKWRKDYDKIAPLFESSSLEETCYCLWEFCRDNMRYIEEDVEDQRLSSPGTMLVRGWSDCKGYALFIGGVLDALNRAGWGDVQWVYRFVPSSPLSRDIGHVFVAVEPNAENIWIDPVLSEFDKHYMFLNRHDEWVTPADVRKVAGLSVGWSGRSLGTTSAEQNLLNALNEYTLGMQNAVSVSKSSGTFNTITEGIMNTASTFIPGVAIALDLFKAAGSIISNNFGPGSLAARLLSDIDTNLLTAPVTIVESILNGRTYNSDQYAGAQMYYYFVLGNKSVSGSNEVSDAMVPAALKWFIDRTGVFISGQEHIRALMTSVEAYTSLYTVNAYTTTNIAAVTAAVAVAQTYFNLQGAAGSWADTVGVFDATLGALAVQLNESLEQINAQVQSGQIVLPSSNSLSAQVMQLVNTPWFWVGAAVLVALLLTDDKKN